MKQNNKLTKRKKTIESESDKFIDDEYNRVYNAKVNFLERIDHEKQTKICEHVEVRKYLLKDHYDQYYV